MSRFSKYMLTKSERTDKFLNLIRENNLTDVASSASGPVGQPSYVKSMFAIKAPKIAAQGNEIKISGAGYLLQPSASATAH